MNALDVKSTTSRKMETYNIGLVILQDFSTVGAGVGQGGTIGGAGVGQGGTSGGSSDLPLKLQFYMILTSSQTLFPRQTLDKERGVMLKRSQPTGLFDRKFLVVPVFLQLDLKPFQSRNWYHC